MKIIHRVLLLLAAELALVMVWSPALAAEAPSKQTADPISKQPGTKLMPGIKLPTIEPSQKQLRHRERAVTSDDYKPLAGSTPGVQVHRVTQPRPSSGGADAESPAPASRKPPSSLRDKDRKPRKKSSVDN